MLLRHNFTEVSSKLELIAAPHSNREAVGSNPCERVHCSIPQEQLLPTSTPGTHPFYSPTSILPPTAKCNPAIPARSTCPHSSFSLQHRRTPRVHVLRLTAPYRSSILREADLPLTARPRLHPAHRQTMPGRVPLHAAARRPCSPPTRVAIRAAARHRREQPQGTAAPRDEASRSPSSPPPGPPLSHPAATMTSSLFVRRRNTPLADTAPGWIPSPFPPAPQREAP